MKKSLTQLIVCVLMAAFGLGFVTSAQAQKLVGLVEVTDVTATTALASSSFAFMMQPKEKGFCWSKQQTPKPSLTNNLGTTKDVQVEGTIFKVTITGLEPETTYYLVSYAISSDGSYTSYSDETVPFTTAEAPPNDPPTDISLSNASIMENQPSGTTVGTFTTTDPDEGDTHTYSLVSGSGDTNNSSFTIDSGTLKTAASLAQGSYSIRVKTDDSKGGTFEKSFTVTVTGANQSPTDISLSSSSLSQNQPVGTAVGTFSTTDPDAGDTHTYSLVSGTGDTNNSSFSIDSTTLKTAASLAQGTYSIRVQTNDGKGGTFQKQFTITVTGTAANNPPEDITLSNAAITSGQPSGTLVGTLSTYDIDTGDTHTYSLVSGPGDTNNASFSITGNSLKTAASLTQGSYSVRVQTDDGKGGTYKKSFTITVTSGSTNQSPTDITLSKTSVAEGLSVGTAVGTFTTTDPDTADTHTYSLVSGSGDTGNASFSITGSTLRTLKVFDYYTQNSYSIRVKTNDGKGGTFEKSFTISITTSGNHAPTDIILSETTVSEDQAVGTLVGLLSTEDPDPSDSHTYTLASGEGGDDNDSFTIDGNALTTAAVFTYEEKSLYSIRIRANDGKGGTFEKEFSINVTRVGNHAPEKLSLSSTAVAENQPAGTTVGTFSTDDPDADDTHTYSLVSGTGSADNSSFTIEGDALKTAAVFDSATQSSYNIRVRTDDGNGGRLDQTFTVNVTDKNEAPTDITLSNSVIDEQEPADTEIGTFSAEDTDPDDIHFYTLVSGDGGEDNGYFSIDGDSLKIRTPFDFETKSSFSILVEADDNKGGTFQKAFTITVNDVNELPTDISLSSTSVGEFLSRGTEVGTFTATDQDRNDTHTYMLVGGEGSDGNASFTIDGNTLRTNEVFDSKEKNSYTIRVRTEDSAGETFEKQFTIKIVAAPTVSFSPANGATKVALDVNITLTFNKAIRLLDDSTITNINVDDLVILRKDDENGEDVVFDAIINGAKTVITINPVSDLESNQKYYTAIKPEVEDASDNAVEEASITFTTKDITAPTVTFSPANGATDVSATAKIKIIFNEPVRNINNTDITDTNVAALIYFKKDSSSGDSVPFDAAVNDEKTRITITPGTELASGQTYYLSVGASFEDYSDNVITKASATFTVMDLFTDISADLSGVARSSGIWGDYDGDGDLDVLLAGYDFESLDSISRIYRNENNEFYLNSALTGVYFGSIAYGDYDRDGKPDILLTGYDGSESVARVYHNDGNGRFTDIYAELTGVHHSSGKWGDYNRDGYPDILLTGYNNETSESVAKIYRNNRGSFEEIQAGLTGVYYSSATWGDYDKDGDLDILITGNDGFSRVSTIYRNDGNGVFKDIGAGLMGVSSGAAAWGDYDGDGDLDILLTGNDGITKIAKVYRNDNGKFRDINAGLTGVYQSSAAWGDYDLDGDVDILITGDTGGNGINKISRIYRNDKGTFVPIEAGLVGVSNGSAVWGDYDRDGDPDILLTGDDGVNKVSKIYRNNLEGDCCDGDLKYVISVLKILVKQVVIDDFPTDITDDGRVSLADAIRMLRISAGIDE
jgi:hypothetical protein